MAASKQGGDDDGNDVVQQEHLGVKDLTSSCRQWFGGLMEGA
jgi:hypothetical protein